MPVYTTRDACAYDLSKAVKNNKIDEVKNRVILSSCRFYCTSNPQVYAIIEMLYIYKKD